MFRLRALAIATCILTLGAVLVQAQGQDDDAKAVLRKAIKAHGGEKLLSNMKGITAKFKGTIDIMGKAREMTGENVLLKPDKLKTSVTVDIEGMQIPVIVVFDGKKMWRSVLNKVEEIKDEKVLTEMRESLQAEGAGSLPEFLEAPYKVSTIGEVKVMGKDAVGIRVTKKGQRDITFYFDKKTHLVVKSEMRVNDTEAGQEVTQEKFITAYRDTDGVKTGSRLVIHKDGKLFMELDITETKVHEKLDESNFKMP